MYDREYKFDFDVGRMIMKNKFLYLVLSMIMCFSFIGEVFAEGLEFSFSAFVVGGNTSIVKETEAVINVSLNSDVYLNKCSFNITSDSTFEFVSGSGMNKYEFNSLGSTYEISRDATNTQFNSGLAVMQLKYKINGDGKVTIKNLECSSASDNQVGTYGEDIVLNFKAIDETANTTLKKISVTGGTLSPSFSSSVKNYSINLDNTTFSLELTASNADYQDDIVVTDEDGNKLDIKNITFKNNNQGNMPIVIKVNNDTVYNLLAVYKEKELNNSLKILKVDGKEVSLENGKYDYSVTVGKSVNSVKIEASLNDTTNFKFIDEFNGTQIVQTPSGTTSYPIIIEPSKSSVGAEGVTYIIKLVKESDNTGNSGSNNNNNTSSSNGNVNKNPTTGGLSFALMICILMCSLVGSIYIYQKKLDN